MFRIRLYCVLITTALLGQSSAQGETEEYGTIPFGTVQFWGSILAIIALVLISGVVAGLTLGLISLDETKLQVLAVAGTEKQRHYASRIIPIRKNSHLLLTSLVLTNTVVNETLPVVFDSISGKGYIAVIASTLLIVIFSEILPQAICTRHGLQIGALLATPVKLLIYFWYIIAWPVSKGLDLLLGGKCNTLYSVPELHAFMDIHKDGEMLHPDTVAVIKNTLNFQTKRAGDLTHQKHFEDFMLSSDSILDSQMIQTIVDRGHSLVPVYEASNQTEDSIKDKHIIGALSTKCLALVNPESKVTLKDIELEPVESVPASMPAIELLKRFQLHKSKMAVVHPDRIDLHLASQTKEGDVAIRIEDYDEKKDPYERPSRLARFSRLFKRKHKQAHPETTPVVKVTPTSLCLSTRIITSTDVLDQLILWHCPPVCSGSTTTSSSTLNA